MNIDDLTTLVALILAISLASERLVTIIKTIFPTWLADEQKTDALEVDLVKDRGRRLTVQIIAFVAAWITASFLTKDNFDMLGVVTIKDKDFPVILLGLLASGGSALWNNILGYTKAVKDIKVQQRASEGLQYHNNAISMGANPIDGGMVGRSLNKRNDTARVKI